VLWVKAKAEVLLHWKSDAEVSTHCM